MAVVSLAVGEVREIWVLIAHKRSCLGKGWIAIRDFSSLWECPDPLCVKAQYHQRIAIMW